MSFWDETNKIRLLPIRITYKVSPFPSQSSRLPFPGQFSLSYSLKFRLTSMSICSSIISSGSYPKTPPGWGSLRTFPCSSCRWFSRKASNPSMVWFWTIKICFSNFLADSKFVSKWLCGETKTKVWFQFTRRVDIKLYFDLKGNVFISCIEEYGSIQCK